MSLKKILTIIGARPQFIKHYPFELACRGQVNLVTVHTGQHYDEKMSAIFFDQLGMTKPDYQLATGGGNHGAQTGKMMQEIEVIVINEKPDYVVVYGDTNSTLAGALVASKLHIPIVHIEAGLRSYNRQMPEEINRVLTDHISSLLFCPSEVAVQNLKKEGITEGVFAIGDLMKDLIYLSREKNQFILPEIKKPFYYVTLHRPYNVDEKTRLLHILTTLNELDKLCVFAIHPRTRIAMTQFGMEPEKFKNIIFIDPQPYFENLGYIHASGGLITDSGGMQKEAYWLEKKCVTVRSETEWIETLVNNANTLVFENLDQISLISQTDNTTYDSALYGDSKAAQKIVDLIIHSSNKT
jgi:UDP-GlcNAc3NAcA epimerase